MRRAIWHFVALGAALATASPVLAQTPDIFGQQRIEPISLGPLVQNSQYILLLEVEKASATAITFRMAADLKEKASGPLVHEFVKKAFAGPIVHQLPNEPDGLSAQDHKSLRAWAQPGRRAVCFHDGTYSYVCLGNYWYAVSEEQAGGWQASLNLSSWRSSYVGSVDQLRAHVEELLVGKEVVATADLGPGVMSNIDWLRGEKIRMARIKAGPKYVTPATEESPEFVAWGLAPEAVPGLLAALKHRDSLVRAEAAGDLGQVEPKPRMAVPALREALREADVFVRIRSAEALARIDKQTDAAILPILIDALAGKDSNAGIAAGGVLARLEVRAETAVPALLKLLASEKDPLARVVLIMALGEISPESTRPGSRPADVMPALVKVLEGDAEINEWLYAAMALPRFGAKAAAALPALKAALRDEDRSLFAAYVLIRLGPASLAALDEALQDPLLPNRSAVVEQVRELGPLARPLIPALMGILKEEGIEETDLRWRAVSALLGIDRPLAGPLMGSVLTRMLKEEQSDLGAHLKHLAMVRLGDLGPEARPAVPAMIEILMAGGPHTPLQTQAVHTLGRVGRDARPAIPVLLAYLKDDDPQVRFAAAQALWAIDRRAEEIMPVLGRTLGEPGARNRRDMAVELFRELGGRACTAVPILMRSLEADHPDTRADTAAALGAIGPEARAAVPALRRLLSDVSPYARVQSAAALCNIGAHQRRAVARLQVALQDERPSVRAEALAALQTLDPEMVAREFLPLVVRCLLDQRTGPPTGENEGNDDFSLSRGHAEELLRKLGPKARPALPDLVEALRHRSSRVRAAAVRALDAVEPRHPALLPAVLQILEQKPAFLPDFADLLISLGRDARAASSLVRRHGPVYCGVLDTYRVLQAIDPPAAERLWPKTAEAGPPLESLWNDLGSGDGPRSERAWWTLALTPDPPVDFFKARLRSVRAADEKEIARLVADLESAEFAVRQQASAELEKLEKLAEPMLRGVLEKKASLEACRRAEQLLEKLEPTSGNQHRVRRAIELLERIGTADSKELLTSLAKGAAEAALTQQAKTALGRLK